MTDCVFCGLIEKKANVLYDDEKTVVMLSPEPATIGHMLVLPRQHAPILEAVPDFVVGELFKVANKVSTGIFEALGVQGTNILVQNGPPAGQRHNHVMVHVVPRMDGDNLPLVWQPKPGDDAVLSKMESAIKEETRSVGSFEREKPKPIEAEKPKEVKKDDYRLKSLRRIP